MQPKTGRDDELKWVQLTLRQELDDAADGQGKEPHNQIHEVFASFHEQDLLTGFAVHERYRNALLRDIMRDQLCPQLRHGYQIEWANQTLIKTFTSTSCTQLHLHSVLATGSFWSLNKLPFSENLCELGCPCPGTRHPSD
jgi:hypothetical protein